MPRLNKKRKFSRVRKYQNGGKDTSFISRFLDAEGPEGRHLRNLDRMGVSVEDIKKFYETGVISDDISDREIQGGKNLSPEDIRAGLKYHLDNMDDRRDSSGNLDRVDSQVTYDYFSGLLKLSDEELPRSYRRVFGLPAQFYDFPDMDEIKPIGVTSISTDVSDKELQMSEEQKNEQDPNYLPKGAWRKPHYSYDSIGIPKQDGWIIYEKGPLDPYTGTRKIRMYVKYFEPDVDGSYTMPRSIRHQTGGKIKIKKKRNPGMKVKKFQNGGRNGDPIPSDSTGVAASQVQPVLTDSAGVGYIRNEGGNLVPIGFSEFHEPDLLTTAALDSILESSIPNPNFAFSEFRDAVRSHEGGTKGYSAKQIGGGPGRGAYQFNEQTARTAYKRLIRIADEQGYSVPELTDYDFKNMHEVAPEIQDLLFTAHFAEDPKSSVRTVLSDKSQWSDQWAKGHWKGDKKDYDKRTKSFEHTLENIPETTLGINPAFIKFFPDMANE